MSIDFEQLGGWVDDPVSVGEVLGRQDMPLYGPAAAMSQARGIGAGKRVLLYQAIYKALGGPQNYNTRLQGIGDCFPAGSPVRMADGTEKAIEDVQMGDMVLTHLNRPRRVTNTIRKSFSGELVTITPVGYQFPLTATADHQLVTYPDRPAGRNRTGIASDRTSERTEWAAIGGLGAGDRVLLPQLTACEHDQCETLDIRQMAGCDLRRYRTTVKGTPTTAPFGNPITMDAVLVDERFARFVGLWLAEGSCEASRIAFSLSRREELLAAEIIELGSQLFGVRGIVDRMPSKPNVLVVKFNSTPLARFFAGLVPGNVWTKRVPDCFMRAPRRVKLALLRGWCDGDGSGRGYNQNVGTSVSRDLRYTLAQIAMSAGLKPCCPSRKARGRSKEAGNVTFYGDDLVQLYPERADLRVRSGRKAARTQLGLALPIKTVTREPVTDSTVYCLEVEHDHSFVVSGYAVHNCVSMGGARAVDILRAVQVAAGHGSWRGETATEPLYAFGRIEVGGGRLGNSDGSVGAWQADACKRYGTLIRAVYGQYDLTTYSAQRAREWGAPGRGVPDALEPTAREHLVRTVSLVTTWEELCDAIASGYPVTVASNQGFTKVRDSQGFARASGNWPHQMCFIGVDDLSARKGACIDNSWGDNWISGPRTYEQPKGSFWVDKATVESMLRAQDSWAYSDYVGFPAKKLHFGDIF